LIQRFNITVGGRSGGGTAGGIATTGSGCPGGLHTVTGVLGTERQFQPWAAKSCQPLTSVDPAAVLTALGGLLGLVGVWLQPRATAQAARANIDTFVVSRMVVLLNGECGNSCRNG
jgi:hypothetical protein